MASTKKANNVAHSGHTPGPWHLQTIRDRTDEYECFLRPIGLYIPDAISEEDARLLVAAPDLLAACERADALLGELRRHLSGLPAVHANNVLETVRAAIRKAKGE